MKNWGFAFVESLVWAKKLSNNRWMKQVGNRNREREREREREGERGEREGGRKRRDGEKEVLREEEGHQRLTLFSFYFLSAQSTSASRNCLSSSSVAFHSRQSSLDISVMLTSLSTSSSQPLPVARQSLFMSIRLLRLFCLILSIIRKGKEKGC
jgi:hypothetical protein